MNAPFKVPSASRVAERALVLAAIGNRGLIENEAGEMDDPQGTGEAMCRWLVDSGVREEVEPQEWDILSTPVGELEWQSTANSVWRLEGLGVLLWSLGLYDLPTDDQLVSPPELFDLTQLFDPEGARRFIASAALRPANELSAYRTHILMLHWRLREFRLRPKAMDFVEFSKDCWFGSFDVSDFSLVNNDVALGGTAISDADPELLNLCGSITQERHTAANWLVGEAEVYSEIETHT